MATFVDKGHWQGPQTRGVCLLGGCVYYAEYGIWTNKSLKGHPELATFSTYEITYEITFWPLPPPPYETIYIFSRLKNMALENTMRFSTFSLCLMRRLISGKCRQFWTALYMTARSLLSEAWVQIFFLPFCYQLNAWSIDVFSVISQCMKGGTLKKNPRSVATKVMLQIQCKLGGELWAASPPGVNVNLS